MENMRSCFSCRLANTFKNKGDLNVNDQKFVVCDPTYIGAPVGATMPDMDNGSATVILLE